MDVNGRRKQRREALREELKSREYLRQLHDLVDLDWVQVVVDANGEPIVNKTGDAQFYDKSREFTGKAHILLKLLAKTLPDVRYTEQRIDGEVKIEWDQSASLTNQEAIRLLPTLPKSVLESITGTDEAVKPSSPSTSLLDESLTETVQ